MQAGYLCCVLGDIDQRQELPDPQRYDGKDGNDREENVVVQTEVSGDSMQQNFTILLRRA